MRQPLHWQSEHSAILQRCLNRIAPQYRETLYLVYDLEMRYAQVSQVMACDTTRTENRLKTGRKTRAKIGQIDNSVLLRPGTRQLRVCTGGMRN